MRSRPLLAAALALLLAACSTAPPKKSVYYQDDGPPDRVPADVAAIPDAQPRVEPLHRGSSKPYTALGRTYTPMTGDAPFSQRGMASWYGKQFHGSRTANGEIYDMLGMSAAHPTLPLPSYVRVTSVRNGRSVIVRVNDRGPFKSDRIIDLSYAAAAKLGIAASGTGEVEIERITMSQIASGDYRRGATTAVAALPQAASPPRVAASRPLPAAEVPAVATVAPDPAPAPPSNGSARGWAVQLGAFAQEANADALVTLAEHYTGCRKAKRNGAERSRLLVRIDHDTLRGQLGNATLIDTGQPITAVMADLATFQRDGWSEADRVEQAERTLLRCGRAEHPVFAASTPAVQSFMQSGSQASSAVRVDGLVDALVAERGDQAVSSVGQLDRDRHRAVFRLEAFGHMRGEHRIRVEPGGLRASPRRVPCLSG